MEAPKEETKIALENYTLILSDIKKEYRVFIRGLEACFSVADIQNVGFNQLRKAVVMDLMCYYIEVVPITQEVLILGKEAFDYFIDMEFDDFLACFDDVVDNFNDTHNGFQLVVDLHGPVLKKANCRSISAQKLLKELLSVKKDTKKKLDKIKKEMEEIEEQKDKAKETNFWDIIPIVSTFRELNRKNQLNSLDNKMESEMEKEERTENNLMNALLACETLDKELVPALENYVKVIEKLKQIFNTLCIEIQTFLKKNQKIKDSKTQKKKKAYYKCVRKMAQKIITATVDVNNFYSVCIDRIEGCLESVDKNSSIAGHYKEISGKIEGEEILNLLEDELRKIKNHNKYEKVFKTLGGNAIKN